MISAHLRRTVRVLYAFACGYCGVSESEVGSYLTVDHFMPQDVGGSDDISNLVYACHTCNMHKSTAWNPAEPRVLHPLRVDMDQHISPRTDGTLQGLTPDGVRHIETLHLNRPPMVERRRMRHLIETVLEQQARWLEREQQINKETRKKRAKIRRKKKP